MKKRKKQTGECHDCGEARELIARYMGGDEDERLARKVLLHAQTCTECAALLRNLDRLVHFCSLEPTREMPMTGRRELRKEDVECRECTEAGGLISERLCGELDHESTKRLILHAQSCPNCARLLRTLMRLVHTLQMEPPIEMPPAVRSELWVKIRYEIHTSRRK